MTGQVWSTASAINAVVAVLALVGAAAVLSAGTPASRLAELARPVAPTPATGRALRVARRSVGGWLRRGSDQSGRSEAAGSVPAALALELRAGRDLGQALRATAAEHGHLPEIARPLVAAALAVDRAADPAPALLGSAMPIATRAARTPLSLSRVPSVPPVPPGVAAVLRPTASCLSVGQRAGLPIADLLESTAAAAYGALETAALSRAELAGAKASAALLGCLPVAGLALGQLAGAAPARFLVGSAGGRVCLLGSLVLTLAGWAWTRALTRRLSRQLLP